MTLRICSWLSTGTRQEGDSGVLVERKRGSDPAAKASFPDRLGAGQAGGAGIFQESRKVGGGDISAFGPSGGCPIALFHNGLQPAVER